MSKKQLSLSDSIQKTISTTWGKDPWKFSKGCEIRDAARSIILTAFLTKPPVIQDDVKTDPDNNNAQDLNVKIDIKQEDVDDTKNDVKNDPDNNNTTETTETREAEDTQKAEILTFAIEQRVYESFFVFNPVKYARRIRLLSIHISRNPERFSKMDPCFVATMNSTELGQDITEKKDKEKRKREDILKQAKEKEDKLFQSRSEHQCGKCKGFDTSFNTAQTRSGDEAVTVFFTCHNEKCRHRWRG